MVSVDSRPAYPYTIALQDSAAASVPVAGPRQRFKISRPPDFYLSGARPEEVARGQHAG
jgi:hypothetical protein